MVVLCFNVILILATCPEPVPDHKYAHYPDPDHTDTPTVPTGETLMVLQNIVEETGVRGPVQNRARDKVPFNEYVVKEYMYWAASDELYVKVKRIYHTPHTHTHTHTHAHTSLEL